MIIGLAVLLAGAWVTIQGIVQLDRAMAMRRWVPVEGEIYSSRVVEEIDRTIEARNQRVFRPDVRYSFVVEGTEYAGSARSAAKTRASWRGFAEGVMSRYPVGRKVLVYYDPQNPRDSIVERGTAQPWAMLLTVAGVVTAVSGGVWAWLA